MSRSHRIVLLALAVLVTPLTLVHAQGRSAEAPGHNKPRPGPSPNASPVAQRNAQSARCSDGTLWNGAERSGACSNHGGVKEWMNAREDEHEHEWREGVTARCNDGTVWTTTNRQGACSSHGGVKKWRVDDDDERGRPREAKARCTDGSWWIAETRQGACASHGGVHHWLARHAERPERH